MRLTEARPLPRSRARAHSSLAVVLGALILATPALAAPATGSFQSQPALLCAVTGPDGPIDRDGPFDDVRLWPDRFYTSGTTPRYVDPADPAGLSLTGVTFAASIWDSLSWGADRYQNTVTSIKVRASHSTPAVREVITTPISWDTAERFGAVLPTIGPFRLDGASREPVRVSVDSIDVETIATSSFDPTYRKAYSASCTAQQPPPPATTGSDETLVQLPVLDTAGPVAVAGLSQSTGTNLGGNTVDITGPGMNQATSVLFGDVRITKLQRPDAATLRVTTPAHALGTVPVTVVTAAGSSPATSHAQFTFQAREVESVSPAYGGVGGGNTVLIRATDLDYVTSVRIGGKPAAFKHLFYALEATVPPGVRGKVDILLSGPNGDWADAPGDDYEYRVGTSSPSLLDADGGTPVTISGLDLTHASGVNFGGTPGTGFERLTPTSAQVISPDVSGESDIGVSVVFDDGTPETGVGVNAGVTVAPWDAFPTVTGLSATSGSALGGTVVTITGDNVGMTRTVVFGTVKAKSWTRAGPKQIRAIAPAATAPGTIDVFLRGGNPAGGITNQSAASAASRFTYVAPQAAPALVTGVFPKAQVARKPQLALIVGSGFSGTRFVSFGSYRVQPIAVSPGAILVVTPALSAGSYPVVLGSTNWQTSAATAPKLTYR